MAGDGYDIVGGQGPDIYKNVSHASMKHQVRAGVPWPHEVFRLGSKTLRPVPRNGLSGIPDSAAPRGLSGWPDSR